MSDRSAIVRFLDQFKLAVEFGRVGFVPRGRTEQDLVELGLTRNQAFETICALVPEAYIKGPEPDDVQHEKEIWVFGITLDKVQVYIKLRLMSDDSSEMPCGAIWSFHKAEFPLKFPLMGDES